MKTLTLEQTEFVANGNKYLIEINAISAERWLRMQELEIDIGYGMSYKQIFDNCRVLYDKLQESKFVDASVIVHNIMSATAELENREIPILDYCACFINREGEDRMVFDESLQKQKVEDWKKDYDVLGFFQLAVSMVGGLRANYLQQIKDISKELNEKERQKEQ